MEHSSDATFDRHWLRIIYLISSNLFFEMGVIFWIIYSSYFTLIIVLIDVRVHLEYVQVIRSNIGPESVEKCRDVQNEPIWTNFRKKTKGIVLKQFFKHRHCFLILTVAFLRHIIKNIHLIDWKVSKYVFCIF
jgi:hypothetical protein